ncbi:hypothetical protein HanXRQr2_Chr08g0335991 [Helianthus annuus]|uniref:Uncharacterized protein n=1 Tax=Helianthus annuus TaxID=4232 RepID=A0A9K3IF78_HELAN|nr:hypothetical protein HanXRQr2_Chr08g0335991 [Helianthus annuus]KAJ0546597.1 hypothetical protein HanIR_Chr08g0362751 [Helianthus annuus]KAJ0901382.1 hypothetical protein HanPSC8_Chr08g0324701 [Helianthus annuus]
MTRFHEQASTSKTLTHYTYRYPALLHLRFKPPPLLWAFWSYDFVACSSAVALALLPLSVPTLEPDSLSPS